MNIVELLQYQVDTRPNAAAIIDKSNGNDRVLTFTQIQDSVTRTVACLANSGLKAGDRLLVLLPVSAELYVALLAIFRANMVAILPDPSAGLNSIGQLCTNFSPSAAIFTRKTWLLRWLSSELRHVQKRFCVAPAMPGTTPLDMFEATAFNELGKKATPATDAEGYLRVPSISPESIDDIPALLTFTSGSTGTPKAIMRTQQFLHAQNLAVAACTRPHPGSIQLVSLPVFVLANLAHGVASILPDADLKHPGDINAYPVVQQIEKFGCREMLASPAFIERIADYCIDTERKLPTIKHVFTGGAPVFGDFITRASQAFPCAQMDIVYGSTEAEPIAHLGVAEITPEDYERIATGHGLPVGSPAEGVKVAVLAPATGNNLSTPMTEENFRSLVASDGTPGELVVAGAHVVKSYLLDQTGVVSKIHAGQDIWHRTGDAGYIDSRGRIWLLGRVNARIEDQSGTVYPFAVEGVARMTPGVERAGLVSKGGERVLAVQCKRRRQKQVTHELEPLLKRFALSRIVCMKRLPVDGRHNSKIDYAALRRRLT